MSLDVFVALLGLSLIGFVASLCLSHLRFVRWRIMGVALLIMSFAYLVCRISGFVALFGLSHFWVCRVMTFVALWCLLSIKQGWEFAHRSFAHFAQIK